MNGNKGHLLKRSGERFVFFGFFFILLGLYLYSSYWIKPLPDPNNLNMARFEQVIFGFGFNGLRRIPVAVLIITGLAIFTGMAALLSEKNSQFLYRSFVKLNEIFFSRAHYSIIACLIFLVACVTLQSNMVSADMVIYQSWIPKQFLRGLMHVRFDEMWESNLHFNAYIVMHTFFGWDVLTSYRMLSSLSAPFFLFILLKLCRQLIPDKALQLCLFLLSGGYVQLFFGDMEYYTISITLVLAYFYTAYLFIKHETTFLVPAMILALAMTFHMETVFLIPSLFFLSIVGLQRRMALHVICGWLGLVMLVSLTLLFFLSNGIPLENLVNTSWGLGRNGNVLANFLTNSDFTIFARLNTLALIFPAIWFLLVLFVFTRIHKDLFNGFLISGAIIGITFTLLWVSSIGLYSDWNLFSMPLFPAIVLLGYNLIRNVHIPGKAAITFGITALSMLLSYSWIVSNHFLVR